MAEVLAGVSIAANIIQLVQFGKALVDRLDEYRTDIDGFPEAFKHIKYRLKILVDGLSNIKEAVDSGALSEQTQKALRPSIRECAALIQPLSKIIEKALPPPGASRVKRSLKALGSLRYDAQVEKMTKEIDSYIAYMNFHSGMSRYVRLEGMVF